MRLNKFFLLGAAGLAVASCSQEKLSTSVDGVDKGGANARLEVRVASPVGSRTDAVEWEGSAGEAKVANLYYYQANSAPVMFEKTGSPIGLSNTTGTAIWKTKVFKTSPGFNIDMAVVLNGFDGLNTYRANAASAIVDAPDGEMLNKFISQAGFVMSSATKKQNIIENVEEAAVTPTGQNYFKFNLERVVVKGVVMHKNGMVQADGEGSLTATNSYTTEDGDGYVPVSGVKFTAVNGGAKTYLFADKAGTRNADTPSRYDGFESAIHDKLEPSAGLENPESVKEYLFRLGNYPSRDDRTKNANYYGIAVNAYNVSNNGQGAGLRGVYFFENSYNGYATGEHNLFGYYRYAYAKVYAQFIPKQIYKIEVVKADEKPAANGGDEYTEIEATEYTTATAGVTGSGAKYFARLVDASEEYKNAALTTTGSIPDFYVGTSGKSLKTFFTSKEAAKLAGNTADQIYTYTKGQCAYRALWHVVKNEQGKVIDASVRRNNVYVLTIKGFKSVGMPWDPSDPNDPNLPKPENETGTTPPGSNPSVDKVETNMAVESTALPWNVVASERVFGVN